MWEDPIRRQHFITQVGLESSTATVGIVCVALMAPTMIGMLICPLIAVLTNFFMFEFVLEPRSRDLVHQGQPSLVGPYWERGPRDGERYQNP